MWDMHHDENRASTSRISAETRTEGFDYLYLSLHTPSQFIASRIYQRLLHLLTSQITHQGFWILNWLKDYHLTLKMASAQVVET